MNCPRAFSEAIDKIFESKIAKRGGPVRRRKSVIADTVGIGPFLDACRLRGYRVLDYGDQFVVFCGPHEFNFVV